MVEVAEQQTLWETGFIDALAYGFGDGDGAPDAESETMLLGEWIRDLRVRRDEVLSAMHSLRKALLDLSILDRAVEPIPMRTTDEARNVEIMAVYLMDLLCRLVAAEARSSRPKPEDESVTRRRLLDAAVARLSSQAPA
jgi:hypothetical protein